MAAIDKIYGTIDQYDELLMWCAKHNPAIMGHFSERSEECDVVANFPMAVDKWLQRHCPIEWVTARIDEQYSGEVPGCSRCRFRKECTQSYLRQEYDICKEWEGTE